MRVIHLSTAISDSSAAVRQHKALLKQGVNSYIYTMYNLTSDIGNVIVIKPTFIEKVFNKVIMFAENLVLKFRNVEREGLPFSIGWRNVSLKKYIKPDDIIHFHWTCGFISNRQYQKIKSGYSTVITCHDNWYLTGGCHVRMGCTKDGIGCKECSHFKSSLGQKVPMILQKRKCGTSHSKKVVYVSPSAWMDSNAKRSLVTKNVETVIIPNTLEMDVFNRRGRDELRKKLKIENSYVVLFGAVNGVNVEYKGFKYLIEALKLLKIDDIEQEIVLLIFGSSEIPEHLADIGYRTICLGKIDSMSTMAEIYSCADVLVVPSLEDSFNQTVVESQCCETPVVAFKTGGIIENIEHMNNGYLADYRDSVDLAKGIVWIYENNENNVLGKTGRTNMINKCNEEVVARKLMDIYKQMQ